MRPARGLLRLLVAWLGLGLVAAAWPPARAAWGVAAFGILALVARAAWTLRGDAGLSVERECSDILALGTWSPVRLKVHARRGQRLLVHDHHPVSAETEGLPVSIEVPAGGWAEVAYRLRPTCRGTQTFAGTDVLRLSPGDILRRRHVLPARGSVRVIPNFRPVLADALVGIEQELLRLGVHVQRRRGEGSEFQQLREYRPGDVLRQVDWKASSRRGQLVSRQYQEERNQNVVLVLDCSRRMRARDGELTHFDHVLNAVLLLAFVAVRQGDAVGLLTFGGDERWLAPVKGPAAMPALLHAVHDLGATPRHADLQSAAGRLLGHQRRRALVVVLTNLRDEDPTELLAPLRALKRRHLVVVTSAREEVLDDMTGLEVRDLRSALDVSAAHAYLAARRRTHEALAREGVLVADVLPRELPTAAVERYLEIKRAGRL